MGTIDFNLLKGQVGMQLCTAGSREVLINGQLCHVRKGMLCFHSPLISIHELGREETYEEASISDDIEVFYPIIKVAYNLIISLRLLNRPCIMLDEAHVGLFRRRVSLIESRKSELTGIRDEGERLLVTHIIHLLERETMLEFIHFYWKNRTVEFMPARKNEVVTFRFICALHLHCKKQRSVGFYAREANLSQSHFTRLIKEKTGRTPAQWIADMTVINAKQLLAESNKSIKEVAAELHFPEQFTFRKFFKAHVGLSPKDYRQQNRQKNAGDTTRTGTASPA